MEKNQIIISQKISKFTTSQMIICSFLAALAIVLEKTSFVLTPKIKFTFYGLPLMVAGVMLGPKAGFFTGIVCGIVSQMISPYGISISSIFWALSSIAWGFVSAICFKVLRFNNYIFKMTLTVIITSLFATLANTIAMIFETLLVKDSYYTLSNIIINLPSRLILMVLLIAPYTISLLAICKSMIVVVNKN